ncbi:hypothetical protein BO70DRAFT_164204 [Aspergillus heteromorphus CBS 117.55]|uniref:Uncharacterized protein n=1 Tax=Aspergillus heteromorphus CBS 117.55 TaxID=1448321 RepID=A0A317WT34_9EURO|nr:uncharacterized protein BO70DRAFT_164204 [Aspergillus heteromorphus CBS 117.55]PWY89265.1 hypothetical protein BO70DRAFT_164204 [Aspergillus heteromorphus CBS 117.55]
MRVECSMLFAQKNKSFHFKSDSRDDLLERHILIIGSTSSLVVSSLIHQIANYLSPSRDLFLSGDTQGADRAILPCGWVTPGNVQVAASSQMMVLLCVEHQYPLPLLSVLSDRACILSLHFWLGIRVKWQETSTSSDQGIRPLEYRFRRCKQQQHHLTHPPSCYFV